MFDELLKKSPLLKYNLQFHAGEGDDGADDTGEGDDNQDDAKDKGSDDKSKKPDDKLFTQKELDEAIKARLKRERQKQDKDDKQDNKSPEDKSRDTDNKVSALEAKLLCFENDVSKDCVTDVVALAKAYVDEDTDFEAAIQKVIKKYPQFVKGSAKETDDDTEDDTDNKSWGQRQKGKTQKLDPIEEAFYKRNPDLKN